VLKECLSTIPDLGNDIRVGAFGVDTSIMSRQEK